MLSEGNGSEPRLFMLFNHYNLGPELWRIRGDFLHIKASKVFDEIKSDLDYLLTLLEPEEEYHGFAFIFLDPGWTRTLELLKQDKWHNLGVLVQSLTIFQNEIDNLSREAGYSGRIRIVTASRLYWLLVTLYNIASPRFTKEGFRLLAGEGSKLFYDGPKIIEAAIRIANIGRNIPTFRFDHDVLYYIANEQGNEKAQAESTRENIRRLCKEYDRLSKNSIVSCFVFSGHYGGTSGSNTAEEYLNGFATRVAQLAGIPSSSPSTWKINEKGEIVEPAEIDITLCDKFLTGLKEIGANPYGQVISGAGFCLNDSAILDLPPYSNMRQNVMWIDDHLKHSLHHELRHLGYLRQTSRIGRVDDAKFTQLRHGPGQLKVEDVKWHLKNYMIRLLLGCVADSWLRGDSELKNPDAGFKEYLAAVEKNVPGYYASEFQYVLLNGWDGEREEKEEEGEKKTEAHKRKMKKELWNLAKGRLQEFVKRETWENYEQFQNTFFDLYLHGYKGHEQLESMEFLPSWLAQGGLEKAVKELPEAQDKEFPDEEMKLREKPNLEEALTALVEDFVGYIDLVRSWKDFVQAVRHLLNWEETREGAIWMYPGRRGWVHIDEEVPRRIREVLNEFFVNPPSELIELILPKIGNDAVEPSQIRKQIERLRISVRDEEYSEEHHRH